jgi:hypothetical protein
MAYDDARGVLVMQDGSGVYEFDGYYWTLRASSGRTSHAMTYVPTQQLIVGFGGRSGQTVHNDTWKWTGSAIVALAPTLSPPPRSRHMLAYDASRTRLVMFGGESASGQPLSDTWEFDGATWAQVGTPVSPSARMNASMAYHATLGRIVMFGGMGTSGALADTWTFDGATWSLAPAAVSPPPASAPCRPAMTYHGQMGVAVLATAGETWTFDGYAWSRALTATPAPCGDIAYSLHRNRIEGYWERRTWALVSIPTGATMAQASLLGASNLNGSIQVTAQPMLGHVLTFRFTACNDWEQRYFLALGFSSLTQPHWFSGATPWGGNSTWLSGSSLLITPDVLEFMPWVPNNPYCFPAILHMQPIPIPLTPSLAGTHIFGQVFGWQQPGSQTQWGLSQAIDWRIGF